jgi:hypothetical protein
MTPTDDDIRAMLSSRADRVRTGGTETEAALAAARGLAAAEPRAARRFGRARWTPRAAGGLASLAAVALAFVVLAVPLLGRPAASGEPSIAPSASGTATPPTGTPAPSRASEIEAISAEELQALVDARGGDVVGLTIAVEGSLESNPSCGGRPSCRDDAIVAGTSIPVLPVGDIGPGPWDGSGPISGTFALRLAAIRGVPQGVIAQYLGDIRPGPEGLAWPLPDIIAGASREETGFVVARGWIVRSPLHPCPTRGPNVTPNVQSQATFGCPSDDWLTVEKFQPLRGDGSSITPAATDAIYLWSGTYDEWAPDPSPFGVGVEPREGTFLLSWIPIPPCGPNADCFVSPANFQWIVRGRLDPLPSATPPTDEPVPTTGYFPGGIPISVDGQPVSIGFETQRRLATATDDTSFLAGGFALDGPMICSGGIGPSDPNPLGARGCPRYQISGIPGRLFVPERLEMPQGDTPIVVRVHTRDPGAETCWPQTIDSCRARVVVEALVWTGDPATRAAPLGPNAAVADVLSIAIADNRVVADKTTYYVDEPRFVIPITCEAPFPPILFAVRGDPRLGLLAVFGDKATRSSFQDSVDPQRGTSCLDVPIDRPAAPRWIGHENILVLAFADDAASSEVAAQLAWTEGQRTLIPLPDASIDRSRETLLDYLAVRAAGPNVSGDVPMVSFGAVPTNKDGNPAIDVYAGWSEDAVRRYKAQALDGVVELITRTPTRDQLGDSAAILDAAGNQELWLYRVTYPAATDQRLTSETFVVYHTPGNTFRDWGIARAAGEPFPIVPIPEPVPFPSGMFPVEPINPGGSGDTPCLPAGQECG